MNNDEIEEMSKDFLNMAADKEIGKVNSKTLDKVNNTIARLNAAIDEMPSDDKTLNDYLIIALCHQYYRFRDVYLS